MAEWSKALRSGRSLFGGAGSNPASTTLSFSHVRGFSGMFSDCFSFLCVLNTGLRMSCYKDCISVSPSLRLI